MAFVQGASLSRSKIRDVIKLLRVSKTDVIRNYFEYVPRGPYSEDEQIGFIVAAMPNVGMFPASMIVAQLERGPMVLNTPDFPGTKPNLYKVWHEAYPEQTKEVAEFYAPHKNVPDSIKSSEEWCCLCALAEMIDWGMPRGLWPRHGVPTVEQLHETANSWLAEYRRSFS